MSAPTPVVSAGLRSILTTLRLGQMADTLPERLVTARECSMPHVDFLEMVLADEVARREKRSAGVRAKAAHLDPSMVLEAWDETAAVSYDRAIWAELTTLRFVDENHNALILGPVGVGKTFLATALGHIACRRRYRVHFERADRMFKRLKAARLDNSAEAELRKLIAVDLLVIDLCRHRDYPDTRQDDQAVGGERAGVVGIVTGCRGRPGACRLAGSGRPAC